jgi:hypothetical protein
MSHPLLHERYPALRGTLPHVPLEDRRPTPVAPLDGLAASAGIEPGLLWLKDDGA